MEMKILQAIYKFIRSYCKLLHFLFILLLVFDDNQSEFKMANQATSRIILMALFLLSIAHSQSCREGLPSYGRELYFPSGSSFSHSTQNSSELILLQFVFRHGDRNPRWLSKKDHYQEKHFPLGLGQLTNRGREQMYFYGKVLAQRYVHYLSKFLFAFLPTEQAFQLQSMSSIKT